MSIDELTSVVTPPVELWEGRDPQQLAANETELGVRLPDDVIQIGETYGTGEFSPGITIFNPHSRKYFAHVKQVHDILRNLRRAEGVEFVAYEIHPASPGLLLWGQHGEGHQLCWLTAGERNDWPIVVRTIDGVHQRFEMSTTTFMAKTCRGELQCVAWSSEWIDENCRDITFEVQRWMSPRE